MDENDGVREDPTTSETEADDSGVQYFERSWRNIKESRA